MTEAEKIKSTLSSIFRRKGANGQYTRLFDNLDSQQQNLLLGNVQLNSDELAIIGSAENSEIWFLLTTQRVVWRVKGSVQSLSIHEVWHASADFPKMIATGTRKHQLRELRVETVNHEERLIELEEGAPLFGVWNVLLNLGSEPSHEMKSLIQVFSFGCLLWLMGFVRPESLACTMSSPLHAPAAAENIACDHQSRRNIGYDYFPNIDSGYDNIPVLPIFENAPRSTETRALSFDFTQFLAAEGEGALAGSIRNVNPTGGTMNCVNCAVATDATLGGNAASALPGGVSSIRVLENTYAGTFQPVSGQMQIGSILFQSGNGARGIVYGESLVPGAPGHVFNVLNNGGTMQFLDGQIGGSGLNNFGSFQNFQFLLTHPGTP